MYYICVMLDRTKECIFYVSILYFVFSALSDSMVVQNASFAVYFVCLLLFSSIANLIQFSIHCRNRGPKSLIVTCINLKKNSVTYIIYQVYTISIVTS